MASFLNTAFYCENSQHLLRSPRSDLPILTRMCQRGQKSIWMYSVVFQFVIINTWIKIRRDSSRIWVYITQSRSRIQLKSKLGFVLHVVLNAQHICHCFVLGVLLDETSKLLQFLSLEETTLKGKIYSEAACLNFLLFCGIFVAKTHIRD